MPAARFWRVFCVDPLDGGDLELSELALYEGETRVDGGATITSAFAPTGGELTALVDGDLTDAVRWSGEDVRAPGFALTWYFGAATPSIDRVDAGSSSDVQAFPRIATLAYSSDGVLWTPHCYIYPPASPVASQTYAVQGGITNRQALILARIRLGPNVSGYEGSYNAASNALYFVFTGAANYVNGVTTYGLESPASSWPSETYAAVLGDEFLAHVMTTQYSSSSCTIRADLEFLDEAGSVVYAVQLAHSLNGANNYAATARIRAGSSMASLSDVRSGLYWFNTSLKIEAGGVRFVGNGILQSTNPASWDVLMACDGSAIRSVRISNVYCKKFDIINSLSLQIHKPTAYPSPLAAAPKPRTVLASASLIGQEITGGTAAITAPAPSPCDIYDGGRGRIAGTVKEKNTPANTPLNRRVVLLSMPGSRAIRETWSDPVTGVYAFDGVAMDRTYTAVSYDHTGIYRGVVADNLVPEMMP